MERLSQVSASHGDAPAWPVETVHSNTRGFYFRCTGHTITKPFSPLSPFKSANRPLAWDPPSLATDPFRPFPLGSGAHEQGAGQGETWWVSCSPSQGSVPDSWGLSRPRGLGDPQVGLRS